MATLILQTRPDGSIQIAVPEQPLPPEMLADAELVADAEQAAAVVRDVLGNVEDEQRTGEEDPAAMAGAGGPGATAGDPAAGVDGTGKPPQDDEEEAMQTGFDRARKGY